MFNSRLSDVRREVAACMAEDARRGRDSARAARTRATARRRGPVVFIGDRIDRRKDPAYRASRVRRGQLQPDGTIVWLD